MRKLTVKREKAFLGSGMKMCVYIEDSENAEVTINGVGCRNLGRIKNGEERTFEIDGNERKIFVIDASQNLKHINDYYTVPEGTEDVTVQGKNYLDVTGSSPFKFDGHITEKQKMEIKKTTDKYKNIIVGIVISTLAIMAFVFRTSDLFFSENKEFVVDEMHITLTDAYSEQKRENALICYETKDTAVHIVKDDINKYPVLKNLTIEKYIRNSLDNLGMGDKIKIEQYDNIIFTQHKYKNPETKEEFYFLTTFYKTDNAFWQVAFVTDFDDRNDYYEKFLSFAKTITFDE